MNYIEFLQQRAFSEGYVQRMFDEAEEKEEKLEKRKINADNALIATGGLGLAGVGGLHARDLIKLRKAEKAVESGESEIKSLVENTNKKINELFAKSGVSVDKFGMIKHDIEKCTDLADHRQASNLAENEFRPALSKLEKNIKGSKKLKEELAEWNKKTKYAKIGAGVLAGGTLIIGLDNKYGHSRYDKFGKKKED